MNHQNILLTELNQWVAAELGVWMDSSRYQDPRHYTVSTGKYGSTEVSLTIEYQKCIHTTFTGKPAGPDCRKCKSSPSAGSNELPGMVAAMESELSKKFVISQSAGSGEPDSNALHKSLVVCISGFVE